MSIFTDAVFLAVLILTVLCGAFCLLGALADWIADRLANPPIIYPSEGLLDFWRFAPRTIVAAEIEADAIATAEIDTLAGRSETHGVWQ